jgi:hypothetical protein
MDGSSSEGPVVEIVVPPGVAGGMLLEFSDETGNIHSAVVPDGLVEGDVFTVQLPPPEPPPLEIVIPSGLQPGDAFVVQHEGQEFEVIVPDGSYGDDVIFVHAPPVDEPAAAPEPAPSLLDKAPVEDSKSMSWYSRTEDAPQKGKGVQLSLNLGGGLSLNLALAHVCAPTAACPALHRQRRRCRRRRHLCRQCLTLPPPPLRAPCHLPCAPLHRSRTMTAVRSKASTRSIQQSRSIAPMARGLRRRSKIVRAPPTAPS